MAEANRTPTATTTRPDIASTTISMIARSFSAVSMASIAPRVRRCAHEYAYSKLERVHVDLAPAPPTPAQRPDRRGDEAVRPAQVHIAPGDVGYQLPNSGRGEQPAWAGVGTRAQHVPDVCAPLPGQPVQLLSEDQVAGRTRPVDDDGLAGQRLQQ